MTNLERLQDLYDRMSQGQMMEAFEDYYAEDVQVIEGSGEVRDGKAAQREALHQWQGGIKGMHGIGNGSPMSNEQTGQTSIESWVDATMQDGNRMKMEEVCVQNWKDGKIVKERFYYNVPGQ